MKTPALLAVLAAFSIPAYAQTDADLRREILAFSVHPCTMMAVSHKRPEEDTDSFGQEFDYIKRQDRVRVAEETALRETLKIVRRLPLEDRLWLYAGNLKDCMEFQLTPY